MHSHCFYYIVELSTPERMRKLNESIQRRTATTKQSWIGTSSLLATTATQKLPVKTATTKPSWIGTYSTTATHKLPVKTDISVNFSLKRRIEYYSDDDDDDDDGGLDHDHSGLDRDDNGVDDIMLTMNIPELQLPPPSLTPTSHDKIKSSHDLNHSPPKDPQDVLADKIASYVAASSDDSSPDTKVIYTNL